LRKIIVTDFVTLDGVTEAPEKWTFPFGNDEIAKFKYEELFASDALLLGRVTYQVFAAWPSRTDEAGFADRLNHLPKFVVSTTLERIPIALTLGVEALAGKPPEGSTPARTAKRKLL